MGSIDRLIAIWKAHFNEALDQLEDPEKMARQLVRDMEVSVDRTTAAVAGALADQRRLEREVQRYQVRAEEYRREAEQAVAAGDEARARQVLERKAGLNSQADELSRALEESRQITARLREELDQLRASLRQAQARQGALIARYQSAKLQRRWGEGAGPDLQRLEQRLKEGPQAFEQLEQRVEAAEAEAQLRRELAGETERDTQERNRENQARVEEELQALRRKLNKL
ncbi:MAG: PspA/IM30 family protein [Candidatus Latescibacteria bacterium]|nr:PspA/IM30 family protein [Candidatus Latescibacterota bacterium]